MSAGLPGGSSHDLELPVCADAQNEFLKLERCAMSCPQGLLSSVSHAGVSRPAFGQAARSIVNLKPVVKAGLDRGCRWCSV